MDDLRYGVVGAAGHAATHLDALADVEGATLVACADVSPETAERAADEYGIEAYTDHAEMLAAADVDAISVATPSGTHGEITVDAANAGVHVLCEKPLDVNKARVDAMIDACEDNGVTLAGVFNRRWPGDPRRARRAVVEGELGEMTRGLVEGTYYRTQEYYDSDAWRGERDADGGPLFNQAIHDVDLLQWAMGPVERVSGRLQARHRDISGHDTAIVGLEFASGAYGQVAVSTVVAPERPVRVAFDGEAGSVVMVDSEIERFATNDGPVAWEPDPHPLGTGIPPQVQEFVSAIHEGREPMIPGTEARTAVDIGLAAYESSDRGGDWIDFAAFVEG